MGFDRTHLSDKKDIVSLILTNNGYIAKHSIINNQMWAVEERPNKPKRIILFLLNKHNGRWGYKDIMESEGPFYHDCPLKYLKKTPVANQDWRDLVESFHVLKKLQKRIVLGDTVFLEKSIPNEFVITNLNPLQGIAFNGKEYRIIRNRISQVKHEK